MNIRFHLPGGKAAAGRKQKAAATKACLNSAGKKEEIRVTGQAVRRIIHHSLIGNCIFPQLLFTGVSYEKINQKPDSSAHSHGGGGGYLPHAVTAVTMMMTTLQLSLSLTARQNLTRM